MQSVGQWPQGDRGVGGGLLVEPGLSMSPRQGHLMGEEAFEMGAATASTQGGCRDLSAGAGRCSLGERGLFRVITLGCFCEYLAVGTASVSWGCVTKATDSGLHSRHFLSPVLEAGRPRSRAGQGGLLLGVQRAVSSPCPQSGHSVCVCVQRTPLTRG